VFTNEAGVARKREAFHSENKEGTALRRCHDLVVQGGSGRAKGVVEKTREYHRANKNRQKKGGVRILSKTWQGERNFGEEAPVHQRSHAKLS